VKAEISNWELGFLVDMRSVIGEEGRRFCFRSLERAKLGRRRFGNGRRRRKICGTRGRWVFFSAICIRVDECVLMNTATTTTGQALISHHPWIVRARRRWLTHWHFFNVSEKVEEEKSKK